MNFDYTEEQTALQDTLRRFFARDYGFEHRRAMSRSADGFDRAAWATFAEFGILALPFPEGFGGLDGSAVDSMLVMEMLGRGLALEPYLPTVVLCGGLIRDAGSAAQKEALLPAIAGGELMLAFAHNEAGGRYALNHVATKATPAGNGWKLDGIKAVVLAAPSAGKFIVSAREGLGLSLFLVDAKAPGLSLRSYPTQDGARAADIRLSGVEIGAEALIGPAGGTLPLIERAVDYANAALCAEAVGIMAALNEVTLEYLKTRKQFGTPIGKFQALQHRMADMVIATEQARSMATLAAVRADSPDSAERSRCIAAAKAYVLQSARLVGQQAVQLHGGMGVTDELNVGHYFKRLTMIGLTFGDVDYHLGRFSDSLLAA
ncbi:acyl-CoA dehydrogenase family protein [Sulfuritalea sp.]|uniref:acyl-CoA dehydrogenase family protein n=1 Tax=Sulfuritalea sp. TaxID=2480090 RepID=UPI001AC17B99|nr:acyl-CoA dehydrogenase family protein [Sulfuritalea sp.]MBN8474322.1 acyl-CoA dehydrogenase family protein [Sulfuritalea sp.]